MAAGSFTDQEMEQLAANPNVFEVRRNQILYSTDFIKRFLEEYQAGKKPSAIFRDAGFDPKLLGSKRIERASARFRAMNGEKGVDESAQRREKRRTFATQKHMIAKLEGELEVLRRAGRMGSIEAPENIIKDPRELSRIIFEVTQERELEGCISEYCRALGITRRTYVYYLETGLYQ